MKGQNLHLYRGKYEHAFLLRAKFDMHDGFLHRPELIIDKYDSQKEVRQEGKKLLLVMLNPGGATPNLERYEDGPYLGVYPDPTLRQVLKIMDQTDTAFCKVINLYSVVCAKSEYLSKSEFRKKWLLGEETLNKMESELYDAVLLAYGKLNSSVEQETKEVIGRIVQRFPELANNIENQAYPLHPLHWQDKKRDNTDGRENSTESKWIAQTKIFLSGKGFEVRSDYRVRSEPGLDE